jgi:hypothetical protein
MARLVLLLRCYGMDFYRGVVRSYDDTNHRANVLLVGSMSRVLSKVPVAHQIGPELMVEGAACGVLFFAEGGSGLVVCTFDGAPGAWVTSDLIKEGTVSPGDLAFSPATPDFVLLTESTSQALTTTATGFGSLSQTVTVPTGKTYNVLVVADVEMENSAWTAWNHIMARIHNGSAAVSQPQGFRTLAVNERSSVSLVGAEAITADTKYSVQVWKALSRNTESAVRGNLAVLWWEATV